ncbi:translation initiation factor, aIF-2BI family [Thermanaerovibrio acidaminovorans DSM 6589]|uniref:Methylthioribose-1-phosphate isomerase n=1 Tax=Thermanaerovibrio acidaminovorans (strain ATCC 49978 / DSM 6589 / Su883) TaxID=525903 RepID=D1B5H7_THEAS|nr:translation initiation factor, aIF-2BI family [Thermanaerovibrio acidaminovorans DSM 6589]
MMPDAFKFDPREGILEILDQRGIPFEVSYLKCSTSDQVAEAITSMAVRGAPAIGIAAAFGVALDALRGRDVLEAIRVLGATRPTAVNLFWALNRMRSLADLPGDRMADAMVEEALTIWREDLAINRAIGRNGADLIPHEGVVITHCNTGSLATGGYGTALGVIRSAAEQGKRIRVFVDETRPRLQGARLTAFELFNLGIDFTVICDSMASYLMSRVKVSCVIVGADRVAMNGDVANKVGTYSLAVGAHYHRVPFYVAAPLSTFDPNCPSGDRIPIEERDPDEVRCVMGSELFPPSYPIWNPSFDVTPGDLISGIVTELGVLRPPYEASLARALDLWKARSQSHRGGE